MKKILFSLFAICLVFNALTQSIDRSVISSAGQVESTEKIILEWTLGESAIQSYSYGEGQITEGFHQPAISVLPPVHKADVVMSHDTRFTIFPNPTSAKVQIRANLDQTEDVRLFLYNALGQEIMPAIKTSGVIDQTLNLEAYQAGTYLLFVRNRQGDVIHIARILKH